MQTQMEMQQPIKVVTGWVAGTRTCYERIVEELFKIGGPVPYGLEAGNTREDFVSADKHSSGCNGLCGDQ